MGLIDDFIRLSKQYLYEGETDEELRQHFKAQLRDGYIKWIEKDDKVIGFIDYYWIDDINDVYHYEKTGEVKDNGEILYINNAAVDKNYQGEGFRLWKQRPGHSKIAWKTKDNRFKIWERKNGKYKKIFEADFVED